MSGEQRAKHGLVATLLRRMDEVVRALDKASIAEFVELYERPGRLLYLNLLSGIARGFGIAIGVSVVSALFVALLVRLAALNLPIIGEFLASLAAMVQHNMQIP